MDPESGEGVETQHLKQSPALFWLREMCFALNLPSLPGWDESRSLPS